MPALRPLPKFVSSEDLAWDQARRRVQLDEEREWAEALARAKANAERDEELAWERALAEAKARTAHEEEGEWKRRRSAAHSGVVPRVLVPQVIAQPRGRISFWP